MAGITSTEDFLRSIMSDVAIKEARVRELQVESSRLERQISELQAERDKVKVETASAIQACCSHADQYKQEEEQARLQLESVVEQVEAQRKVLKAELDAHKDKVASVKGQYAAEVAKVKAEIAQALKVRDGMAADKAALLKKWS